MTRIARETPPQSGNWVITGEPDPRHPRQAPQFECAICRKVIAKTRDVYLLTDRRVTCWKCSAANDLDFVCCGTRAAIATRLGIWPARSARRLPVSDCICDHEAMLCRCGHPVGRHVIASGPGTSWGPGGTFVCPVHGWMAQCQVCGCSRCPD